MLCVFWGYECALRRSLCELGVAFFFVGLQVSDGLVVFLDLKEGGV